MGRKGKVQEKVLIVAVLDRSGSMGSLASDVIGNYNQFIEEQKKVEGKAEVSLVLFNDQYEEVYKQISLEDVPELTSEVYHVRGLTALNDAVCKAINSVPADYKRVIFLIQTDGYENASREYRHSDVQRLVNEGENKGWHFEFMGANIDSMAVGAGLGINAAQTLNFAATPKGVASSYAGLRGATVAYREGLGKDDIFATKMQAVASVENEEDK
jgi:hypothetical protein